MTYPERCGLCHEVFAKLWKDERYGQLCVMCRIPWVKKAIERNVKTMKERSDGKP